MNYVASAAFYVGFALGSVVLGICGDANGRVITLIVSYILALVGNVTILISSNVILYSISRFLVGISLNANFVMIYVFGK